MSNLNSQAKTLNDIAEVQDLSNETAAAIQGGYDLQVYDAANGVGRPLAEFNFGTDGLNSRSNDKISSVRVKAGRWAFFEHAEYNYGLGKLGGRVWEVTGKGLHNAPSWINNKTSSLRRY